MMLRSHAREAPLLPWFFAVALMSNSCWPEKIANISRRDQRFPLEMTFEVRLQKFHANDVSLSRSE